MPPLYLITGAPNGMLTCFRPFVGVGIVHTWGGVVLSVSRDGPAAKAGIKADDQLRGFEVLEDATANVVGKEITLYRLVGEKWRPVKLRLATICHE